MTCAEMEDLILEGGSAALVDAHVRQCADCRAFQESAWELNEAMMRTRQAPARLGKAVMIAIAPRPTYLPEVLDFVGWAAMLAVMIGVVRELLAT